MPVEEEEEDDFVTNNIAIEIVHTILYLIYLAHKYNFQRHTFKFVTFHKVFVLVLGHNMKKYQSVTYQHTL